MKWYTEGGTEGEGRIVWLLIPSYIMIRYSGAWKRQRCMFSVSSVINNTVDRLLLG